MVYNVKASSRKAARKAAYCRAWLNGHEVTNRCFYADPRRGVVRLYELGSTGGCFFIDPSTGSPATEERHGKVVVRRNQNHDV